MHMITHTQHHKTNGNASTNNGMTEMSNNENLHNNYGNEYPDNFQNSSYRNAYPIQSEVVKSKKHCLLYPNPLSRGLLGSI